MGSDEDAKLSLSFTSSFEEGEDVNFRMSYYDARRMCEIGRSDFERINDVQYVAGQYETSTSGTLRFFCSILTERGDVLATHFMQLSLRPDWHYSMHFSAGPNNPYRFCFGWLGFEARSLESVSGFSAVDSLFMVWGGNSISNLVLYSLQTETDEELAAYVGADFTVSTFEGEN